MPGAEQTLTLEHPNLGSITYNEADRLECPSGLLGFPSLHHFFIHELNEVKPFQYLLSEDNTDLALLVVDPKLLYPDYQLRISREALSDLNMGESDATAVKVIASLNQNPADSTLNFKGPLVFNFTKGVFQQVVDEKQELKVPLIRST